MFSLSHHFDFKTKKISSLDSLHRIDKIFLLSLNGVPVVYAKLIEDEEESEEEEIIPESENIIEEVIHPEEGDFIVFDQEEEEVIVTDEPDVVPDDEDSMDIKTEVEVSLNATARS